MRFFKKLFHFNNRRLIMTLFERVEKIETDIINLQAAGSPTLVADVSKLQSDVASLRSDVGFPSVPPTI